MKRRLLLLIPRTLSDAVEFGTVALLVVVLIIVIVALTNLTATWCPR
jgi:hypothetical protein